MLYNPSHKAGGGFVGISPKAKKTEFPDKFVIVTSSWNNLNTMLLMNWDVQLQCAVMSLQHWTRGTDLNYEQTYHIKVG